MTTMDKAIEGLTDAECRAKLAELAHENERLRLILDALARAGVGKGALVEFWMEGATIRATVCRADVDEEAFAASMLGALREVMAALGGTGEPRSEGVTGVLSLKGDPQ